MSKRNVSGPDCVEGWWEDNFCENDTKVSRDNILMYTFGDIWPILSWISDFVRVVACPIYRSWSLSTVVNEAAAAVV